MTKISHDSEIPAHGQQVITACAFIHQKLENIEKVFLLKRAMTKKFLPGVFEIPGGHVDFGEDEVAGLKREIREELNMNIQVGEPFAVFSYVNQIKGSHSVEIIYFAKFTDPIENITLNPEDHSEYRWVAESELSQLATEAKQEDDVEFRAIKRGFELLRGESLRFM